MLFLKYAFLFCAVVIAIFGVMMFKNFERWFGVDSQAPSDNDSATLLNKSQAIMIWLLGLKLCIFMFFIL